MSESPRTALVVDLASGHRLRLRAGEGGIGCFDFSPDGSTIATGGDDRCVCLWDARIEAGAPVESEVDEPLWRSRPFESEFYNLNSVFDVAFSPDGRFVSAACQNLRVRLYAARDGGLVSEAQTATPGRLRWSGDGSLLLVAPKYFYFATMWRVEDTERGDRLVKADVPFGAGFHHTNSITSISAALRAQRMVTGSLDKSVRVWDLARHECIATYVGHADRVLDADISPDGERIVSASSDGTARLWPGDLLRAARENEPSAFAASFGPLPMPEKRD
jgi:WD40 repeat protein